MLRTCNTCKQEQPEDAFPRNGKRKDGSVRLYSQCKECKSDARMRLVFGLEPGEYRKLVAGQGGVCAICGRPPAKNKLSVDHDHKTGITRGALCVRCNRMLGWVYDNPVPLEQGAIYLRDNPATRILGRTPVGRTGRVTAKRRKKKLTRAQ